jgi:hypothetical protein
MNDDDNLWEADNLGAKNFVVSFEMNPIQISQYKIIDFKARSIKLKCEIFQLYLTLQNNLSFKTVKKIILMKTEMNNFWIMFNLNEALFTDRSKLFEI